MFIEHFHITKVFINSEVTNQQVKFYDDEFFHVFIPRMVYLFYLGLLCFQRNLNLLDFQILGGHKGFLDFLYVNGQSYKVEETFTKPFSHDHDLDKLQC